MPKVLIAGAGKIGSVITHLLASTGDYFIYLADVVSEPAKPETVHFHSNSIKRIELNVANQENALRFLTENSVDAIISCLPYFHTLSVANLAKEVAVHYFDLTEDIHAVNVINKIADDANKAFVPQCGLAPGFINIVAHDLIQRFASVETVKLRCGGLPQSASNALQYNITWSIEGVINEYSNPCRALSHKHEVDLEPLSDLEMIQIDGSIYEAFNTSGGIGSLTQTYEGKINTINYKTIRYPGHCEKMRFLMFDLNLVEDRDMLKKILEHAIPETRDDVVIIYVSVHGLQHQKLFRESYVKKFYPTTLFGLKCTAIQAATASSACAVIDIVLSNPNQYHGRIKQEDFKLADILANRFGKVMSD